MVGECFGCEECGRQVHVTSPDMEVGRSCDDGKTRCKACWFRFKQQELLERKRKRENKAQHQGSLDEQLRMLIDLANREGLGIVQ